VLKLLRRRFRNLNIDAKRQRWLGGSIHFREDDGGGGSPAFAPVGSSPVLGPTLQAFGAEPAPFYRPVRPTQAAVRILALLGYSPWTNRCGQSSRDSKQGLGELDPAVRCRSLHGPMAGRPEERDSGQRSMGGAGRREDRHKAALARNEVDESIRRSCAKGQVLGIGKRAARALGGRAALSHPELQRRCCGAANSILEFGDRNPERGWPKLQRGRPLPPRSSTRGCYGAMEFYLTGRIWKEAPSSLGGIRGPLHVRRSRGAANHALNAFAD
jgi:hypothetical protein